VQGIALDAQGLWAVGVTNNPDIPNDSGHGMWSLLESPTGVNFIARFNSSGIIAPKQLTVLQGFRVFSMLFDISMSSIYTDALLNVILVGSTLNSSFHLVNPVRLYDNGTDCFVAKIDTSTSKFSLIVDNRSRCHNILHLLWREQG
jgi:hypothetical protein